MREADDLGEGFQEAIVEAANSHCAVGPQRVRHAANASSSSKMMRWCARAWPGMLRSWGCQLVTADSAEAALAKLAAQTLEPDLIICDYRLASGKTGLKAIGRPRREFGASIPAFLVSGDTAPERQREVREHGLHLLHTPIAPMRLRAIVNQLLASRASTQAAE